jgi:nuclear GTP-binding protein
MKTGKLKKGGDPDIETVAKQIIGDFLKGNIPYFEMPPKLEEGKVNKDDDLLKEAAKDRKTMFNA